MGNTLFKKIVSKKYDYYSRRSRALLLLQAYRSYMYAATDMRRFRVGTATGFMRLEIEAVALMYLFQNNPSLAYTWFNLRGDSQGKAFYKKTKRANYVAVDDKEAIAGFKLLSDTEGIIPALESAHAISYLKKLSKKSPGALVVVCLSGRGDKDLNIVKQWGR